MKPSQIHLCLSFIFLLVITTFILSGCGFPQTSPGIQTNTPSNLEGQIPALPLNDQAPTFTNESVTETPEPPTSTPTAVTLLDEITEVTQTPELIFTHTPNPFITETPRISRMYEEDYNPLTGLLVDDEQLLNRSPVLVKISNFPRDIRPQSGLSNADIVFEYYIGGSMNRFLAVFYGENAVWAGPIRSGRLIDAQLAKNYQGILVYGGADERVNNVITGEEFLAEQAIDTRYFYACPPICGTDTHSLEGVYVDTAMMSEWAFMMERDQRQRPYGLDTLSHSVDLPSEGNLVSATEVEMLTSTICRSKWVYDVSTVSYMRWEEADDGTVEYVPSVDASNNLLQVDTQNLIILFADYVVYDAMLHDIRIHYADGMMPAIFFRDGYQFSGYWSGNNHDSPLQFFDEGLNTFSLAPGKSWIIYVTNESEIDPLDNDGRWQITFARP